MDNKIDYKDITACLITKDPVYPPEVLANVAQYPFGEILILTHSDSPYRKHELFHKAKNDYLFYMDDDALVDIPSIVEASDISTITVAMKEGHFQAYKDKKMTMGLGWGAVFPKSILQSLGKYVKIYGEDDVFKRETERILTYLNFPQKRLILPITDLPSAWAEDRLWRQPNHQNFALIAEERCKLLDDRRIRKTV